MISDALFLEASAAHSASKADRAEPPCLDAPVDIPDEEHGPQVPPDEQARTIASWIYSDAATAAPPAIRTFGTDLATTAENYSDQGVDHRDRATVRRAGPVR